MASRESILKKGIFDTILLARVCRRHLGCRVDSTLADPGASVVDHARIAHNVEVRANASIVRWAYIEPRTFANGAETGAFCGIDRNVAIDCFKHPYTHAAVSAKFSRGLLEPDYDDSAPSARIGSDMWVGEKAVILRGGVECGAIVGVGAVVTKDVPPCAIVAGAPVRIMGRRFCEEAVARCPNMRWWDWLDEEILQNRASLARGDRWSEVEVTDERK